MQIPNPQNRIKRGTSSHIEGRFAKTFREEWTEDREEDLQPKYIKTEYLKEYPKSLLSRNDSPDIPYDLSLNPYRGCEHGCIYCYARPNHAYVDLSPGIDFESKIFIKQNTKEVFIEDLKRKFKSGNRDPIVFGSVTDSYQPIERKTETTRRLLETALKFKQPVEIITKSSLILRDLDILSEMAKQNLVRVCFSVTTLDKELWSKLEPRTPAPTRRMEAIETLTGAGIPVILMFAPVIPFLNDHEMESIVREGKERGISQAIMILVRLPYELGDLFSNWLTEHYPLKKDKILGLLKDTREGKLYKSGFGQRMTGTGNYAELLRARFQLIRKQLDLEMKTYKKLNTELFHIPLEYQRKKVQGEEFLPGLF
ncbi:PA0069 family radical SAM protein [Leptospira idonii]|uniref:PA0069 family radical SAM protein n=1 Tax=Leptospira idonii TaxID=1193500 RepID=UPI001FEC2677|nr:PA0069 family radical SAM protein [Leptospira idonii]